MVANIEVQQRLTKAELAEHRGISRARVSQLQKRGLTFDDDGKIGLDDAERWLATNLDHRHGGVKGTKAPPGTARDRKDEADAALRELELAKRKGELVERAAVDRAVFELARRERDSWLSWAAQSAPGLAAALGADETATFTELDRHVRRHLESLSQPAVEGLNDAG